MEADQNSRDSRDADGPVVGLTGARFGGAAGRRSRAVVEPPEEDDAAATQHQPRHQHKDQKDQVVGQTGARFPSLLNRWRHKEEGGQVPQQLDPEQQDPEQQELEQEDPGQPGPGQPDPKRLLAEATGTALPDVALPVPEPGAVEEVDEAGWERSKETFDLVRPYFWTGGRTASQVDLAVETLVSATGRAPEPPVRPEHRTILGLCANPRSVAEIAALLKMPLGVARVVLGDLAAAGSISVHRTVGSADDAPDVALMQRVLTGLRRL